MIDMKNYFSFLLFGLFLILPFRPAAASMVGFANTGLWLQPDHYVLEGESVRFFANIINGEYEVFKGDLIFHVNDQHIGEVIPFSLAKEESKIFSLNWIAQAGEYEVTAQIENVCFVCTESGEEVETSLPDALLRDNEILLVDQDSDGDGLGNKKEEEIGSDINKADSDDDGYNDKEEVDAGTNSLDSTSFFGLDTDGDGISDLVDTDIDNDGLYNWEEEALGTDSLKRDSDGDGVSDKEDVFPQDANKWRSDEIVEKKENMESSYNFEETYSNTTAPIQKSVDQAGSALEENKMAGQLVENHPQEYLEEMDIENDKIINYTNSDSGGADSVLIGSAAETRQSYQDATISEEVILEKNNFNLFNKEDKSLKQETSFNILKTISPSSSSLVYLENIFQYSPPWLVIILIILFLSFFLFVFNLLRWLYFKNRRNKKNS